MSHYEENQQSWNRVAASYQRRFLDLDLYDDTYAAFCDLIPSTDARILEIGCGPGNITRQLLKLRPGFDLLATDTAPAMLELAKTNAPAARFAVLDARDIAQLADRYDGIVCGFVLPYLSLEDAKKCLQDCGSLLRPGGVLYLSFIPGDPEASGYQTAGTGDRMWFGYYRTEQVKALLAEAGFATVATFSKTWQDQIHEIMLARRPS